nr:uncharacterized protein LOC113399802 [Vanessa tameamea]
MKYLGLILDGRWSFRQDFVQLGPKLINAAAALGGLLPNVGGPGSLCPRLYAGVVRSMGAVRCPDLDRRPHRWQSGPLAESAEGHSSERYKRYRTVSWTAATLLAGDPPWELQAEVLAEVYWFQAEARNGGNRPGLAEVGRIRATAQQALIVRWEEDLGSPTTGLATVEAVRPHLSPWVKRKRGTLTFRMTQVLTGHRYFGKYLHGIARREVLPSCHQCGASVDTVLGSFCENVMSQKEAAEREREVDTGADLIRRRRPGGR